MDLFVVKNKRAMPSVHALIIEPFKTIWHQDPDPAKGDAIRFFSFIELACSPKKSNPYFGYEKDKRYLVVKKLLFDDEAYELPPIVMDAVIKYEDLVENSSPSYSILNASLIAAEQLKTYLTNIRLNERTNSGAAVYKPKDVINALQELPQLSREIEELRNKIQQELMEEGKTRNNRQVGYYEE